MLGGIIVDTTLPKVSFYEHEISKLLIGDNPIYGYSHFNKLLSQHQQSFHTPEQVVATLKRAEEAGINAWQNSVTQRSLSDLQLFRDSGGKMHWFCLSWSSEWYDQPDKVFEDVKHKPFGMAPHGGGVGQRCLRENRLDLLQDILKRIRDTGVLVGLSVHDPKLVHIAEDERWDIDYYMTALYNLHGGTQKFTEKFGYAPLGEIYAREDRDEMCKAIQRTDKPCLIYKVLAAGRTIGSPQQIRAEVKFAIENSKSNDVLLLGMYQQFGDQIGENAALVSELCAELSK